MAKSSPTSRPRGRTKKTLGLDEALIALFIGAMQANAHASREELARAHHLIWSARRFRRKSGDTVGRIIEEMKQRLEDEDAAALMRASARAVPARLRPSAFALVADLLLADGKIEATERRFLHRLAADLQLRPEEATRVMEAMLVKNRL
ncbi:MAG: tellurite resistance TerB family protein [Acidobacteria bacterium]|nr:tellurite resistance TerB family protein [Acidobacteriota bacterium]